MDIIKVLLILFFLQSACIPRPNQTIRLNPDDNDLVFTELATTWDEGVPIGNGLIGGLIWMKNDQLRISIDRSDLWDLRPSPTYQDPDLSYQWLAEHRRNDTYDEVLEKMASYASTRYAPTKLPGGALEFNIATLGDCEQIRLYLKNALCEITWRNQGKMEIFTHAIHPVGWFRIHADPGGILPTLKPPEYEAEREINEKRGAGIGYDILYLNYDQGEITTTGNGSSYHQKCWGDYHYDVAVSWIEYNGMTEGTWSITSKSSKRTAQQEVSEAMKRGFKADYLTHMDWWEDFWMQSDISIPDSILERQWYNEIYKIGAASRANTPPITLQAVWTADDGTRLPPWKGDYHHDLNTQLSYWPFYSSNKLEYGQGFVDWLWSLVPENMHFTKKYFGVEGLNVPGMTTVEGKPMGGWLQYALSPTTSGWLAHHFYLHWKYSGDQKFLADKAFPYFKNIIKFYEQISIKDKAGKRSLPISSSPEIFNNSKEAWFTEITNYDLAIIRFVYAAAAEMARTLNKKEEVEHYDKVKSEWPDFDLDEDNSLTLAPNFPYTNSHRHFSHLMAFHPFGLIDWSHGESDREIIKATIKRLDEVGPDYWCGYSYSWLGNLKARAMDGQGAAEALLTFAKYFCLPNTFHVNGDQSKSGKSKFTYRPFTLEGNFAFAAGINEMLIQSHTGIVNIFPAIPANWLDVSFQNLRTVGAFLVSAEMKDGKVIHVKIHSELGGKIRIANPFSNGKYDHSSKLLLTEVNGVIEISTQKGQNIVLTSLPF